MSKKRESGIELLRIVAMLFVLIVHANYWRIGVPTSDDLAWGSGAVFVRILVQMLASPCVDVFIIISGYFMIRPKLKSIASLWFLLAFWSLIGDVLYPIFDGVQVNGFMALRHIVFPFFGWFISAYLGLYMIAPILNSYASSCAGNNLVRFLVLVFSLQFFFDLIYPRWSIFDRTIFNGGYSIISFSFLYLLGACVRRYVARLAVVKAHYWFALYFGSFVVWAGVQFMLLKAGFSGVMGELSDYVVRHGATYSNPIVIAGSLFLFCGFRALKFTSRLVNHVALSALGVFCFHSFPFYERVVRAIFYHYDGAAVLVLDGVFILFVFILGVICDQARIWLWRSVEKLLLSER